eukprot:Nk52_evm14s1073 gene=Nk52_evmTU14s1073
MKGGLVTAKRDLLKTLCEDGIKSQKVLSAVDLVDRSKFVAKNYEAMSWENRPLPLLYGVTISQPYVVARMSELLLPDGACTNEKSLKNVLEIGTGSGYQAGILAKLAEQVYTVERIEPLIKHAKEALKKCEIDNVHIHFGDGHEGWAENAPYDAIIVTAASSFIPKALYKQLAVGGKMIAPVGNPHFQELKLVTKVDDETFNTKSLDGVVFVPLLKGTEK